MNHRQSVTGCIVLMWLLGAAAAWPLPAVSGREQVDDAVAEALREIRVQIAADRFEAALALTDSLDVSRMSDAVRAELQQMRGYAFTRQGAYDEALAEYLTILRADAPLGHETLLRTRYAAAQLCFALERYQEAVDHLRAWQELARDRADDFRPLILLGQAYFKVSDLPGAVRSLELGIHRAEAQGVEIREHWLRLLHHLYVEQHQWRDAAWVQERLARLTAATP